MGRLEKQIIAGALALVGILLSVVVYRGLDQPDGDRQERREPTEWNDPGDSGFDLVIPESPEEGPAGQAIDLEDHTTDPLAAGAGAKGRPETSEDAATPPTRGETLAVLESAPGPAARKLDLGAIPHFDDKLVPYSVQSGDTLGDIAVEELGSIRFVDEIQKLNEGLDVHNLKVDQQIWLPSPRRLEQLKASLAGAPAAASLAAAPVRGMRRHEVVAGDSLWRIASRYYGQAGNPEIEKIVSANRELVPSESAILRIGTVLNIP